MTIAKGAAALAVAVASLSLSACSSLHDGHDTHGAHSPYAGMQSREVKALSPRQLDDLRAGRGMSLALAAELNGYPGPAHALELADRLSLSPLQRERTRELFERMQHEARVLGESLIAAERELDALFRERRATPENLSAATAKAAVAQGRLREAHLRYHLAMMDVLEAGQLEQYKRLRGY